MKLIVTAPILLGGEHQEVGTEIEVPEALGRDLIAGNKATRVAPPVEVEAKPVAEAQPEKPRGGKG